MIKKHWWKALAVIILLYTFAVGILTPLNSGIMEVIPNAVVAGEGFTMKIHTYNARYEKGDKNIEAYIKIDSIYAIPANSVVVLEDSRLKASFMVPRYLPTDKKVWKYPVIVNDAHNGAFVRPATVSITQDVVDVEKAKREWTRDGIGNLTIKSGMKFPFRAVIYETIKNTFYHVPLWFGMVLLFAGATYFSGQYLKNPDPLTDMKVLALTRVGTLFGILGCVTGSIWAKNTWGTWWTLSEIKLNVSAIAMLIYLAYFVLRSSFDDEEKRGRVSAVYSIFAFVAMVPLLFVIPRMIEGSLHPGNGGNPGFGGEDLDNTMRMVFYPAIIGWTLLGVWVSNLSFRMDKLKYQVEDDE